ncbi:MAG: cation-translocating P-type ATPase [Chloroflexota bacterium]
MPDELISADPTVKRWLTSAQASALLHQHGPNRMPSVPPPPLWRELGAQMVHFFAVMLWVAAGLAVVAGMPQLGAAIAVVVLVNGLFAFFQEYRAERAAERLRDLLPRRAMVIRDGRRIEIDASELVVGDLVALSGGDRISADLSVVESHALQVDTSTLTGESLPVAIEAGAMAYAGTFVTGGEALGVVTATGLATNLAGIARLTRSASRARSPLALELDRVVRIIAFVAVAVGGFFLLIATLVGIPLRDAFLFAIGVMVALVPEGLLPTITLSLAVGAQRMASRHALVRRLESVETLGSTTFICTDKTGTLTRNEMAVVEIWTPGGAARVHGEGYAPFGVVEAPPALLPDLNHLALVAARCSTGQSIERDGQWVAQGDPMEAALDVLARRLQVDVTGAEQAAAVTRRLPFDPLRRRMSVLCSDQLSLKGAPDAVLPLCVNIQGADEALENMARRGLRVIAVATRQVAPVLATAPLEEIEMDLNLLGLIGLEDPPRAGVAEAIAACRGAGIRVAMITGDHPSTARAIGEEVGLIGGDGLVLEGRDLPADEAVLGALLDREGVIVSRVTPEDKLRIARALHARGHVVAMTGDGVNDGPALQEADIGVAMGRSGTDVAREAADLVLLDDNFATIVAAIEYGRATYANIRRFLTYHLTDNVAELTPFVIWALSGGRFPLAISVLQVLALDIGTDLLPALALGAEPPRPGGLREPPPRQHLLDGALLTRVFLILGPVEALMEMMAFIAVLMWGGWRPGEPFADGPVLAAASGAAFSAVVIGQAGNALACRSMSRWIGELGWTTNRLMLGALVSQFLLLGLFLFFSPLAELLTHASPPPIGWAFALLAPVAVIAVDAAHKWHRNRGILRAGGVHPRI